MKDIVITARRQKIEICFLVVSFIVANIMNIWAILTYNSPIKEIITSIFYVLVFTIVLYAFSVIIRLVYYVIVRSAKVFRKK